MVNSKKIIMKKQLILSVFLMVFISKASFSQKKFISYYDCPVHEFVIHNPDSEFPSDIYDQTVGIFFLTTNDSAFAAFDGIISRVSIRKNNCRVTILNSKKEQVIYSYLIDTNLKIGSKIKKGQFLGKIFKMKSATSYSLNIIVSRKSKYLTRSEAIKLFENCGK